MAKTRLAPIGWKKGPFLTVRPASTSKKKSKRKPFVKMTKVRRHPKGGYRRRNKVLKGMGFPAYQDYLASPLWGAIRFQVLERDGHVCRVCDAPAAIVHHQEYTKQALTGEDLRQLYSLCRKCHEHIELDGGKKIVDLHAVQNRLDALLDNRARRKPKGVSSKNPTACGHNVCSQREVPMTSGSVAKPLAPTRTTPDSHYESKQTRVAIEALRRTTC